MYEWFQAFTASAAVIRFPPLSKSISTYRSLPHAEFPSCMRVDAIRGGSLYVLSGRDARLRSWHITRSTHAWSMAKISVDASMPTLGVTTGCGMYAFTVARDRHVTHDVDICYVLAKVVYYRFCRLRHALHKFFFGYVPLVVLPRCSMYPCFSYAAVGTADTYILIASAESSLCVSLEVGECQQELYRVRWLPTDILSNHFPPITGSVRVSSSSIISTGAEGPSVYLKSFTVLLGRIAVAFVVVLVSIIWASGSSCSTSAFTHSSWDDVGAVLLSGV